MIINSLRARNILKYASLELEDVPKEGIIAISGENESGKSSIGEAICFALFGRTFSQDEAHLNKVLRWGENRCSVILEFTVDGTRYQLGRFLDRDGNHGARLALADDPDETLARGAPAVADRLFEILGYDFDQFVESFYLAQREITTPHPHSVAVKTMAGLAPLEKVTDDFRREIVQFGEMLEEIQAEVEALRQEQEELDFEEGLLVRLEDRKTALEMETRANRDQLEQLEASAAEYTANYPLIHRAEGKRGRARFWRFVTFVLALLAGGLWALLSLGGDLPQSQQLQQLLHRIPGWREDWTPWLGAGALALVVLMAWFWMRVTYHNRVAQELRAATATLPRALEVARAIQPLAPEYQGWLEQKKADAAPEDPPGEAADEAQPEQEEPPLPPVRPEEGAYARLLPRVEAIEATPEELHRYLDAELAWLQHELARKELALENLDQAVDQEIERVQQMARLEEVIEGLLKKEEELRAGQERRRKAIELLEGAASDLSNDFNREIREMVARTLPIFTQGRYQHLRIDPDFTVKVFSADKHDFMELDEVSSGTQRQIMLALRLALSQKLLNRKVKGEQFAFLDEPFAFFDEERTRYALNTLSGLSEALTQIWIVAQDYPEGSHVEFALSIHCRREQDSLKV